MELEPPEHGETDQYDSVYWCDSCEAWINHYEWTTEHKEHA